MTETEFLLMVESFMSRHNISPTTFGLWAMNDSRFVFDLRTGRECFGKTLRRVTKFMVDHEAKQAAKRKRLEAAESPTESVTPKC